MIDDQGKNSASIGLEIDNICIQAMIERETIWHKIQITTDQETAHQIIDIIVDGLIPKIIIQTEVTAGAVKDLIAKTDIIIIATDIDLIVVKIFHLEVKVGHEMTHQDLIQEASLHPIAGRDKAVKYTRIVLTRVQT